MAPTPQDPSSATVSARARIRRATHFRRPPSPATLRRRSSSSSRSWTQVGGSAAFPPTSRPSSSRRTPTARASTPTPGAQPSEGSTTPTLKRLDKFVWTNKDMVITFSAGNEGADGKYYNASSQCVTNGKPIDGVIDTDSIGAPGTAKNCITVGASENYRPDFVYEYPQNDCTSSNGVEQKTWGWFNSCSYSTSPVTGDPMADNASGMGAFSSRGPCDDNRIKPDMVAPGIAIISTRTDKNQAYEQWGICQHPHRPAAVLHDHGRHLHGEPAHRRSRRPRPAVLRCRLASQPQRDDQLERQPLRRIQPLCGARQGAR